MLADFYVPDTIQPREYSMGGGTDGFKYERRGLRGQCQLERQQPAVERERMAFGRE